MKAKYDESWNKVLNFIKKITDESFVLLRCGNINLFYNKAAGLFMLNPFRHENCFQKGADNSFSFSSCEMDEIWKNAKGGVLSWKNPDSDLFQKFEFFNMMSFFRKYGENPDANRILSDEDRFFWTDTEREYAEITREGAVKLKLQGRIFAKNAFCWPTFTIADRLETPEDWLRAARKYKFEFSSFEDEKYKTFFLKLTPGVDSGEVSEIAEAVAKFRNLSEDEADEELPDPEKEKLIEELCECDLKRADIEPYDKNILKDKNTGHWELWKSPYCKKYGLYGRDPLKDIREDGIVGIDFGTKSTVVVYMHGNNDIVPMRVGTGNLRKKVTSDDYENPTIMELVSYDDFVKAYKNHPGRPKTKWDDLKVSYEAGNNFKSHGKERPLSFFSDLKKWANSSSDEPYFLADSKRKEIKLPPYKTILDGIESGDFDPIEIYAYYLGLHINNMRNGIFLDYSLSFPVTYPKKTRDHIVESFKRGIKKSLPDAVLNNRSVSIKSTVSEPEAYAACAMTEYGFEPSENEDIHFGIFDFGGGTADFDFGTWSTSKQKGRNYKITHFKAAGDKFLGGENLLELAAYKIIEKNAGELIKKKITFRLPVQPQCRPFAGSETLFPPSSFGIADFNMKNLMEAVRPVWEEDSKGKNDELYGEEEGEKTAEPTLNPVLFNSERKAVSIELKWNPENIKELFKERIGYGIKAFFAELEVLYAAMKDGITPPFYILLAGNSSKSHFVKELFEESIRDFTEKNGLRQNYFEILPPIGTTEFDRKKKELRKKGLLPACDESEAWSTADGMNKRPTGKTGVAFGLLIARKNGKIEVDAAHEDEFEYFVGTEERGKFKVLRVKHGKLPIGGKWCEFCGLEKGDESVELHFTSNSYALNDSMSIKNTRKVVLGFAAARSQSRLFVRALDTRTVQYAVATDPDSLENENVKFYKKTLSEEKN